MLTRARRILIVRSLMVTAMILFLPLYHAILELWKTSGELHGSPLRLLSILLAVLITGSLVSLGCWLKKVGTADAMSKETPSALPERLALREYFFDPPSTVPAGNLLFKYGLLVLICILLSVQIWQLVNYPPTYPHDRYLGAITITALLLNHLSAFFYFGPRFTFPFRAFSAAFLICVCLFAIGSVTQLF